MAQTARQLAKRLAAVGIGPEALTQEVLEVSAARGAAINEAGLEAQCAFLLEAYGPEELFTLFSHVAAPGGVAHGS